MVPNSHRFVRLLVTALTVSLLPLSSAIASSAQTKPGLRKRTPTNTRLIRIGTRLKIRLEDSISSKTARVGDRFNATVVSPSSYDESRVVGHISSLRKSGRVKGRTTIGFAFDSITLPDGRRGTMHGNVIRVYDSDSVKQVDEEGNVESGGRGKQTLKRSGIGAAAGAVLGGIMGGGKGATIGLIVGGAAGAGSIAVQGSKELKLEPGTEMLVQVTR
jgi:hypothetical protein